MSNCTEKTEKAQWYWGEWQVIDYAFENGSIGAMSEEATHATLGNIVVITPHLFTNALQNSICQKPVYTEKIQPYGKDLSFRSEFKINFEPLEAARLPLKNVDVNGIKTLSVACEGELGSESFQVSPRGYLMYNLDGSWLFLKRIGKINLD